MEFKSNNNTSDKQEIEMLMEEVRRQEEKNQDLYNKILEMGTHKQKKSLEYYVHLRKDLINEQKKLNQQLSEMKKEQNESKNQICTEINALKKSIEDYTNENNELKNKLEEHNKKLETNQKSLQRRQVQIKSQVSDKEIQELKDKINVLSSNLNEKQNIAQEQKYKIDTIQENIENLERTMGEEINDVQIQYNNVYTASKKNEEEFNKLYEDKTNNLKEELQSVKYQLEKKLVHSKNLLNKIDDDCNVLNSIYENDMQIRTQEINNLEERKKVVNSVYDLLKKLFEKGMDKLKNNVKQMKEMYLSREDEMVNMTKTYVDVMNIYGEVKKGMEKNKKYINTNSAEDVTLMNKLTGKNQKLEAQINELTNEKPEMIGESLANLKQKIENNNLNLNILSNKQNSFTTKIQNVINFTNYINKNNNISNSLKDDITENKKKKEELQGKLKKLNISENEDLEALKTKLNNMNQEKIKKEQSIKKYEEKFRNILQNFGNQEEVRTDVLKRLNEQITNYKGQIDKLLESKDNMQTYYIEEINKLKEKMEFIKNENNELKNENQKLSQDIYNQNLINDMVNQEYKQFKEAYKAISTFSTDIDEFNKCSGCIKNNREFLLNDELLKSKEEIRLKNNQRFNS